MWHSFHFIIDKYKYFQSMPFNQTRPKSSFSMIPLKTNQHSSFLSISKANPFSLQPHLLSLPFPSNFPSPNFPLKLKTPFSLFSNSFPTSNLLRVSKFGVPVCSNEHEEEKGISTELQDLSPNGPVYQKTLQLVECSMFAALTGLVYFLSNSLAIEVC